jgi:hypothetical protein
MVLVGIPLFAFTFGVVCYFVLASLGVLQWLAAAVCGIVAWRAGVLLIERLVYRFDPVNGREGIAQ